MFLIHFISAPRIFHNALLIYCLFDFKYLNLDDYGKLACEGYLFV